MRILYFSGIHIEIRERERGFGWTHSSPLEFRPDLRSFVGTADLLVLAGDTGRMRSRSDVSTLRYAEKAGSYPVYPTVVVPGNHEYYRGTFDDERDALLAARILGVSVLDPREAFFRVGDRSLQLGATLWTDYAVLDDPQRSILEAGRMLELVSRPPVRT